MNRDERDMKRADMTRDASRDEETSQRQGFEGWKKAGCATEHYSSTQQWYISSKTEHSYEFNQASHQ